MVSVLDAMAYQPADRRRFLAMAKTYPAFLSGIALSAVDSAMRVKAVPFAPLIAPRPLLVVHSRADGSVPVAQGEALAAAAGDPCRLVLLDDSPHCFWIGRHSVRGAGGSASNGSPGISSEAERMKTVVTLGEILVEIMATEARPELPRARRPDRAVPERRAGHLHRPGGAARPALRHDRLRRRRRFRRLNIERLRRDGVDVPPSRSHPGRADRHAPSSRIRQDGERHFVFNIRHSASGALSLTRGGRASARPLRPLSRHGQLALLADGLCRDARRASSASSGAAATIPSTRTSARSCQRLGHRGLLDFVLDRSDIVLPSGPELLISWLMLRLKRARSKLLHRGGIGAIVVKRGAEGRPTTMQRRIDAAAFRSRRSTRPAPATASARPSSSAGCAGMSVEESLRYANASGAHTVTVKGPMEGVCGLRGARRLSGERSAG